MAVSDIKIKYTIDTSDLNKAQQGFDNLTKEEQDALTALKKYNNELDETGKKAKSATDKAGNGIGSLSSLAGKAIPIMAGVFAIDKIMNFGKVVLETTAKFQQMQKAIDFASGSAIKGAENFAFLKDLTSRLGLDLMAAAEGYKTFSASSNLAGVSIEETNRQFEAVSKAVATLGLSSEDAKGVFLALGQIISKGTVASEELRGQIGERLPGAFNIAAKSMGVTTAELGKMLQKGQVASKDFLPKFATELEKTFGSKAAENVNTLTGAQNKFNSAIDGLILAVGTKLEPFLKGAFNLAGGIATQLAKAGEKAKVQSTETAGAIRAQNDIMAEMVKLGGQVNVRNNERIKQNIAINLLLGMEDKIGAQRLAVQNAINAAHGKTGTTASSNLKKAERELEVLILEEKELTKLAGGYEAIQKIIPVKTEKELKAEYDAAVKLLDTEEKIAKLKMETQYVGQKGPVVESAMLGVAERFGKARADIDAKYGKLGVDKAIENLGIQKAENAKTNAELIESNRKTYMEGITLAQMTADEKEAYEKDAAERRKNLRKVEVEDTKKSEQDMLDEIKRIEEEKRLIKEKTIELGAQLVQGSFDLYQANLDQELAASNARFSEEARLAGDNKQKLTEIEEKRAAKEKEIRIAKFKAEQAAAVAAVIFKTVPYIAEYFASGFLAPLAALGLAQQAVQIAFIMAQPVPEYAEGTKGKKHKGGKAIVGERGTERVVTESGKVYYTPPTATLLDLPTGSQVIPNNMLGKEELFMASNYANRGPKNGGSTISGQLSELGTILKGLPIHQIQMDEQGFQKFIRTEKRTTKILNNRFPSKN